MKRVLNTYFFYPISIFLFCCSLSCKDKIDENGTAPKTDKYKSISGIYPHLAMYNLGGECGTGAVVPWADKLWVITYSPHQPNGSSDKLFEITTDLDQSVREESIGGTPANRMVHLESNKLFIGPYAINGDDGKVTAIPYEKMPGRHTGNARHLFDPEGKIYYATMEEGFYEVDVNTLEPTTLYPDANALRKAKDMAQFGPLLPGAHGKGLYSGQGVMVYSNNGEANHEALGKFDVESGALSEWDGKEWKVVRRNQFVEVTGPGGIYGNKDPENDPIWATGWDFKSVLVGVRNPKTGWDYYRLPKASHSYDGAHGWNTEWPRIRNIGTEGQAEYLMTMHGMFWHFPETFTASNSAGIRPRSSYLKVIGDFSRWKDQLVFGCDDSAQKEFLNTRKQKGSLIGPGQSNSNLWFTSLDKPDQLGPTTAEGAVWISEDIGSNELSEPFLFAGWDNRSAWIKNEGTTVVSFIFEVDKKGDGNWTPLKSVNMSPGESGHIVFQDDEIGEWVRVKPNKATKATLHFFYGDTDERNINPSSIFKGVADISNTNASGGLLWALGDNRRTLGVLAGSVSTKGFQETGYYELDSLLNLVKKEDVKTVELIRDKVAIPKNVVTTDEASVLIVDDQGRRWRLPKGNNAYREGMDNGALRICREVSTERDLLNCSGTFYELPAENADGFAKIRPVASHDMLIHDYASYRGLFVLTGIEAGFSETNEHVITSEDGKARVWAGTIDDLWKLGKPVGEGGPWKDAIVKANEPSDPYLIGFYDQKSIKISNQSNKPVTYKIEVEPIGHGPWMTFKEVTIKGGEDYDYNFPENFQSRWIRMVADKDCMATAWLEYR
tara:strand:+ start:746 stop:3256 length:2511 start_codon:yes stop_codon:yes gene_type:complete